MSASGSISGNGNKPANLPQPQVIHLPSGAAKILNPQPTGRDSKVLKQVPVVCRDFPDGTRVRLVQNPPVVGRTSLAVWQNGRATFVDEFRYGDERIVPFGAEDPRIRYLSVPSGVEPSDNPASMARRIRNLVNEVVPLSAPERLIFGAFGVLSWVGGGLPLSPTLIIRAPRDYAFPLLGALKHVCRYGLRVGEVTAAGLLKASSEFRSTLLIEDYGLPEDILRLLEMGGRPGLNSLKASGAYSAASPRILASPESFLGKDFGPASVVVPLSLTGWPNLARLDRSDFLEVAEHLQRQLLDLELKQGGTVGILDRLPRRGSSLRQEDALRCWAAPFSEDEEFMVELCDALIDTAEFSSDTLPTEQRAVISAVYFLDHTARTNCSTKDIAIEANRMLEELGKEVHLAERKVGSTLTKLGFPRRERGGEGGAYLLELNAFTKDLAHRLVSLHGTWAIEDYGVIIPDLECAYCRRYKLVSDAQLECYERHVKPREEERKRTAQLEQEMRLERAKRKRTPPLLKFYPDPET
jgi:hypothetical protein